MRTIQNDTYGEITEDELAAMRDQAERCTTCGMLATVDPVFHQNRYGHAPTIRRDGVTLRWDSGRPGFVKQADR